MGELLKEYEEVIEALYKAEEWRTSKGAKDWEQVKVMGGNKAYTKYHKLLDEALELQKKLHKGLNIATY